MTKYAQSLIEIQQAADTWQMFFVWQLAHDMHLKVECPDVITYDQLLNKILAIYGVEPKI